MARANVAWQLAEASDLFGNWQRWLVVEELEAALIEQLCGASWRRLEAGIDVTVLSPHGALLRCADALGLVSGKDLPNVETISDREFLRERLVVRLREAVPDISEALLQWNDDLAGELDLAVIDAYDDLRQKLETNGIEAFDEVDMFRPAESWHKALERSRDIPLLPMFRPFILPDSRWSALLKPFYSELIRIRHSRKSTGAAPTTCCRVSLIAAIASLPSTVIENDVVMFIVLLGGYYS